MTGLRIVGVFFILLGYLACVGTDIGNPADSQMASANGENFDSQSPGHTAGEADEGAMSHDAGAGDMGPDLQDSDLLPDSHPADLANDLHLQEMSAQDAAHGGDGSHVEPEPGD